MARILKALKRVKNLNRLNSTTTYLVNYYDYWGTAKLAEGKDFMFTPSGATIYPAKAKEIYEIVEN